MDGRTTSTPLSYHSRLYPCTISITVYGPIGASEEVGTYFQEENIYLQDPVNAELHCRYLNPHRLSSVCTDTIIWTSDLKDDQSKLLDLKDRRVESEVLDIFESNEDLAEAPQPSGIRTPLEK